MKAWNVLEKRTKHNLIILFTAGLFFWISITSLLPTLPAYIQDIGATTQQVGLVMGCFAIGLLLSRTWLGQVADRRGRKLVILVGTVVAMTAPLGYSLVQSISGLAAIRAFHGISIAAFTTGYSALVVDLAPRQLRGELIGYMNLAVPMGMSIGPALGGFLQNSGKELIPRGTGYEILFVVSSCCGFLALTLAGQITELVNNSKKSPLHRHVRHKCLGKSQSTFENHDHPINRNLKQLSGDLALIVPTAVLLIIGLVFGTLVSFLPLFVRELALDFNVGLFYTATAIASFSVRLFAGRASDRYGRGLFISVSLLFYAVSMILLAQAQTPLSLMLAAIAEGTGAGILIPLLLALISDRSHASERGKVFALCMGGFDVGIALAGPVLGFIASAVGYRGIFALSALLAFIAFAIFLTQSNKNLRYSLRFALGRSKDIYALE